MQQGAAIHLASRRWLNISINLIAALMYFQLLLRACGRERIPSASAPATSSRSNFHEPVPLKGCRKSVGGPDDGVVDGRKRRRVGGEPLYEIRVGNIEGAVLDVRDEGVEVKARFLRAAT
jgi:hypothetical protein